MQSEPIEVIPEPVALIEAMRAVGYSTEAAIADLIDNSLSAEATQIHVQYDASGTPFVAILDDGLGMSPAKLTDAMRHGSTNPQAARAPSDLGRFGLGLKTASLSQCRKLTVVSKRDGVVSARRWDLDFVEETRRWLVLVPARDELLQLPMFRRLETQEKGTLVVWQELDRLTAGSSDSTREMTSRMEPLFEHLALVFHRFTQKEGAFPAVGITVNGLPLPPRDPFIGTNSYRQELIGQTISHERGDVLVSPFVLPPVGKLTQQEIDLAGGREGLRGTQGFYVYRTRRLVIWGTWFRLVPKEEFYKLTRVRVDIPNSFDDLWGLDIKKSAAYPPDPIRNRLKELIPHFANTSKRAVTYPGRKAVGAVAQPLWHRIEPAHGQFRYEPNVEHVLIQRLFKTLGDSEQRHLQMVLDFLGGAIPYEAIYADMCGDSRDGGDNIIPELLEMAESLLEITGLPIDKVLEIDPLVRYPHLHVQLKKELES